MTTALVTGASGFIGGWLTKALKEHEVDVPCLVRTSSDLAKLSRLDVEYIFGDIGDQAVVSEAVRGVDVVYHLAAMPSSLSKSRMMLVAVFLQSNRTVRPATISPVRQSIQITKSWGRLLLRPSISLEPYRGTCQALCRGALTP